jgi:aminoglycoside phosphotransferase (APT) family kinase protein
VLFYYAFGLYKTAVIVQQIYARYVQGFTKDERFAHFDKTVAALSREAARAINEGAL